MEYHIIKVPQEIPVDLEHNSDYGVCDIYFYETNDINIRFILSPLFDNYVVIYNIKYNDNNVILKFENDSYIKFNNLSYKVKFDTQLYDRVEITLKCYNKYVIFNNNCYKNIDNKWQII